MKIRISLFLITLSCALAFGTQAFAGVNKSKLIGTWAGDLNVSVHGTNKSVGIEMTFDKDGTVTIKELEKGTAQKANYKIDGDRIAVEEEGENKKKVFLTNIELTNNSFKGTFLPEGAGDDVPADLSITFDMKRGKADKK